MDQNIEKRINDMLAEMTVKEKIGQLNQESCEAEDLDALLARCAAGEIGSFMTSGGTYAYDSDVSVRLRELMNKVQKAAVEDSRMGIPIICARDVIHGHHTMYPDPLAMAASFSPELVEQSYRCIAKEAANDGLHWSFSPMIDMSHDPRWGRCVEGPGEDPYLGSAMAAAAVRGFQADDLSRRDGIAACAKHYVGYGAVTAGRDYQNAEISDQTLRNYYLPAFRAAVDAGCCTVMNAFVDIAGEPVASSHYLLTDILRGEMGFDGFVISDDHAIEQLVRHGVAEDNAEAGEMAITAGLDMDMRDGVYKNHLEELVESGRVPMEVLDEAVRRVLRIKFRLGLFDHPYVECVPVDYDEHSRVARAIADETIVLLKNNGVLPLDKKSGVCIVGSMMNDTDLSLGCWAMDYARHRIKSFRDAMRDGYPDAPIADIGGTYPDVMFAFAPSDVEAMLVVIGQSPYMSGENANVADLELPENQKDLILRAKKTGKKVVGVVFSGRPLALESVEMYFDAIIWGWHNGTEGMPAMAAALFGDVNPSGKLPITFPRVTGQEPIYYNQTTSCRNNEGYYGGPHIRNYRNCEDTPLYPFGYGLSYTTFEYSAAAAVREKISLSEIENGGEFEIKVRVKNTGDVAGKETTQCYIHDCVAKITRPIRELKGFVKESYAPGEERELTFRLGYKELGYWGTDKKYIVEPGKFIVFVGTSCLTDNTLTIEITK